MPPGATPEDESIEPGGFEASSRWLSPPAADDTTGEQDPEFPAPWQWCQTVPIRRGKRRDPSPNNRSFFPKELEWPMTPNTGLQVQAAAPHGVKWMLGCYPGYRGERCRRSTPG